MKASLLKESNEHDIMRVAVQLICDDLKLALEQETSSLMVCAVRITDRGCEIMRDVLRFGVHQSYVSDTTRRGTLSKNQKYCLGRAKIKPRGISRFSDSPEALRRGLRRNTKSSPPRRGPLTEALSPRPRPERPRMGCQFFDSLEAGLGKQPRYLRPNRTPLTKRHIRINAPNYSRKRQPHTGTVRTERPMGQGTGRSRGYMPLCSLLTPILPCAT